MVHATHPHFCSIFSYSVAVASPLILSVADKTTFVGEETRYLDGQFYASGSETHRCDVYRVGWAPGVKARMTQPLGSRYQLAA